MHLRTFCDLETAPIVKTNYGAIRGKRFALKDGKEINAFLGVPYAQPPVKELRFKKPQPPKNWDGILDTRRYKCRSIQKNYIWDQLETGVSISENCLYLNVVAPAHPSDEFPDGYPVLFYVHGGGYVIDSASKYHYKKLAKTLVSKDVIVVTVEYRLGYLGFLCLDDSTGNYGLWDCVEALKFVNKNAQAFGGNPKMITVAGQSAGSCISDLLSLSPVSRDLFQQKILMAGFSTGSWAIGRKDLIIDFCRKKALKLGFERKSDSKEWTDAENKQCLDFLQHVPAREFGMTLLGDKTVINDMRLALTPVIDGELFPKSIAELRAESLPKPSIVGVTRYEGLLFLALGRKSAGDKFLRYCENKVDLLLKSRPQNTESSETLTLPAYQELYGINDLIRKNKKLTQRACVDIMSDLINGVGLHRYCVQNAETGTCYRYMFDQFNPSITRAFNMLLPFTGATHGCEIPFIFNVNIFTTPFFKTKADRRVANVMTRTFANFCKYGNPNGNDPSKPQFNFDWKPVSKSHPDQHLVFTDNVEFKEAPEKNHHAKLMPVLDALYETLSASSQQKQSISSSSCL